MGVGVYVCRGLACTFLEYFIDAALERSGSLFGKDNTISHIIMVWDIFDGFTRNGMTGGQRVVSAEH